MQKSKSLAAGFLVARGMLIILQRLGQEVLIKGFCCRLTNRLLCLCSIELLVSLRSI